MRGLSIKRGDACTIPVSIHVRGEILPAVDVERAEFSIGEALRLYYQKQTEGGGGQVAYDSGKFLLTLTRAQTLALTAGRQYPLHVRVKFTTGDILSVQDPPTLSVTDTVSEEIL